MSQSIDPFQLEIIKSSFDSIADDMAVTLMRTAHSGIVRDSLDFSTSICDAAGQPLAQGVCTPMQLGSFYFSIAVKAGTATSAPSAGSRQVRLML